MSASSRVRGCPLPSPLSRGEGAKAARRRSCGRVWQPWAHGPAKIGQNGKSHQALHCSPRSIYPTAPQRRICR
nr:MAG TPA: hypothetical protein [Caudoviricetes sp.]